MVGVVGQGGVGSWVVGERTNHSVVAVDWPNTQSINYAATKYTNQRKGGSVADATKVRGAWRSSGWWVMLGWLSGGGAACLAGHAAAGEQKARTGHDPRAASSERPKRRTDGCGFVAFCAVAASAAAGALPPSTPGTAAAVSHSRRILLTMVMAGG